MKSVEPKNISPIQIMTGSQAWRISRQFKAAA